MQEVNVVNGLVFPGLAPSTYGDVKQFLDHSEFAKKRFKEASDVIGYSLYEAFMESTDLDYEIRECAFLANTIALLDHYHENYQIEPDVVVGPSFGGMATAVKTESLTFPEVIWITHESALRAKKFYRNLSDSYQTMFIYNLSTTDATNLVNEFRENDLYLEFVGNLGKVICLCGTKVSIRLLKEKIKRKSKVMATDTMNQPIHSKILTSLKEELRGEIFNSLTFRPLKYNIISDLNGDIIKNPETLKQILLDSYDHSVRWDLITKKMKELGIQNNYVVGPKNLFSQLLKKQWNTIVVDPKNFANEKE